MTLIGTPASQRITTRPMRYLLRVCVLKAGTAVTATCARLELCLHPSENAQPKGEFPGSFRS